MPDVTHWEPRMAQPDGYTLLEFTPNGKQMVVAGCGNFARVFTTGDLGQPEMLTKVDFDTFAMATNV
jgi:hypothetical protein